MTPYQMGYFIGLEKVGISLDLARKILKKGISERGGDVWGTLSRFPKTQAKAQLSPWSLIAEQLETKGVPKGSFWEVLGQRLSRLVK